MKTFVLASLLAFVAITQLGEALPHRSHLDYSQNGEDLDSNVNVGGQRYAAIETYSEEQEDDVEVEEISITGCGTAGNIVNAALNGALGWLLAINPNAVRVVVSCGTCTRVLVQVPVGITQADVNVCVRSKSLYFI